MRGLDESCAAVIDVRSQIPGVDEGLKQHLVALITCLYVHWTCEMGILAL